MNAPATEPLIRTDGTILTERELQRGLRVSITASSVGMLWVATGLGIPLTLMLQSLGASGLLIGMATTIQQLAMLVQIPASYLAEHFTVRKKIWGVIAVAHRVLWIIPAILPFVIPNNWPLMARLIVLVVAVSSILGQASTPYWYSWMVDLIPAPMSARFWARRQSIVMAVYLVGTIGVGYLLDAFPDPQTPGGSLNGFAIAFALGGICGVADILIHLGVPETKPHPIKSGDSLWRRILAPMQGADFRWFSFSMGVWSFAVGVVGSFGIIYLRREYSFTYTQITLVTVAASVGAILAGFQTAYVIDRMGARTYAAVLLLIGPMLSLVWFFMLNTRIEFTLPVIGLVSVSQPVLFQIVASLAAGAIFSSIGLCQIRLLGALSPSEGRTMAMAAHWTIVGATGALGPLLGGAVMDWCDTHPINWIMPTGTKFGFYHIQIFIFLATSWFLAVPFMLRVSRSKGDLPFGEALPRLWLGNPLRAVRNVYNIYAVTAAVSVGDRERAVRDLGTGRVALAVSDLIANLDDPSYDVREAAATALGNIDSTEAVDALITRLDAPDSDLRLQIVRALQNAHRPAAVKALLRQLAVNDAEVQFEAARALGLNHDSCAVEPLLDLLNDTTNDKVLLGCAEALGRLDEVRLIPPVMCRLAHAPSPLLRASLLLVLGDLLGTPGEFYKILGKEREDAHGELDRQVAALRQRDFVTDENATILSRLIEVNDTAACMHLIAEISQAQMPQSATHSVIDSWQHRSAKPDRAEVLLALYLVGHTAPK